MGKLLISLAVHVTIAAAAPPQAAPAGCPGASFRQAENHAGKGELRLAIANYKTALDACGEQGSPEEIARILVRLGGMEVLSGATSSAAQRLSRARALLERHPDDGMRAEERIWQAWLLQLRGSFGEAYDSFQAALDLTRVLPSPRHSSHALAGLGWASLLMGKRKEASGYFEQAAGVAKDAGDSLRLGEAKRGLAAVYVDTDPSRAFLELTNAEPLLRQAGNKYYLAQALHSRGNVQRAIGDWDRSIDSFRQAIALKRAIGDQSVSGSLIGLGVTLSDTGDLKGAVAAQYDAERVAVEIGNRDHLSRIYMNLGAMLTDLEKPAEAAASYEKARQFAVELGSPELRIMADANRALLLADQKDAAIRQDAVASIVRLADETQLPHLRWLAHAAAAGHAEVSGNTGQADVEYREAVGAIEGARYRLPTGTGRARYLATKLKVFEQYLSFLSRQTGPAGGVQVEARAFEIAERAKARSLLESLSEAHQEWNRRIPADFRHKKEALLAGLSDDQAELMKLGENQPGRATLLARMGRRENEWDDLMETLSGAPRDSSNFLYPRPARLSEVEGALRVDESLISYFIGKHRSFVWLVGRGRRRMCVLPGQRTIESAVADLRIPLTAPSRREGRLRDPSVAARRLYQVLLAPLEPELRATRRLHISPDGALHNFPFEALHDGKTFLVSRFEVSYVPSASTLLALRLREPRGLPVRKMLALGAPAIKQAGGSPAPDAVRGFFLEHGLDLEPLPHAEREIAAIKELFGASGTLALTRAAAQESWVKRATLTDFGYLHFATHSLVDELRPERSALLLSQGGAQEDGLLQAREIVNLHLNANLVVLSGCRTASGRNVRGEGIQGLTQSFFFAGASSVVASLWDVRDRSTAVFMREFYKQLLRGRTKADALRRAKLSMLASDTPAYRHPYYWAPFALFGSAE